MRRRLVWLFLLLMPIAMTGCSDGGSSSPLDNQAHPRDWIKNHSQAATATVNFVDCIGCHGAELKGNGEAVSCYYCHFFNASPPFTIHPVYWLDPYLNHRGYAAVNGTNSCTKCHGSDLQGSESAPSCFFSSFDGRSCHADGPGQTPHLLDGTYLDGAVHGLDAEIDLKVCQACHGQAGGPGSNPRFNVGIDSQGGTGCESAACHAVNYAHPANWMGQDSISHALAGNIENACTLCHGDNLNGVGGVGVSCRDCHGVSPVRANASGCVSCHGQPPDSALPVGDISPNRLSQHNHISYTRPGETCSRCHNGAGFGTTAHFDDENPADVSFIHPDTSDTMSVVESTATNTTCTGTCHIVTDTVNFWWEHDNKTWY